MSLHEFQARQAVKRMAELREEVQYFTHDAKRLGSGPINFPREFLHQAGSLLKHLEKAQLEFFGPSGQIDTLMRSLPSRPAGGVGISPAAKWGPELRAAKKQFDKAILEAETAVFQLQNTALKALNHPKRVAISPANPFDVILNLLSILTLWAKKQRRDRP